MLRKSYKTLLSMALGLSSLQTHAMDADPSMTQEHLLNRAVQVHVTTRGMKYFDTELGKILGKSLRKTKRPFPDSSLAARARRALLNEGFPGKPYVA